jgi:hypothetical protein
LVDDRFTGLKHFWSAVAVDRPKNNKKFLENLETYKPEGDFSDQEKIEYLVHLTGSFPMSLVLSDDVMANLEQYNVPPLGEFDPELGVAWFIPREIITKKTKNGKTYWIVNTVDISGGSSKIKCWGVDPNRDVLHINRPYMAKLDYSEQWGFSTRSIRHSFKLLA